MDLDRRVDDDLSYLVLVHPFSAFLRLCAPASLR
jgi:hypothetical protein